MKKIPTLFLRNHETDRLVRNEVAPGCEWVLAGEGVPTRKWDGTCCLIRVGRLYKRYEMKRGGKAPPNFEPACEVDEETGKQQGWVPVGDGPDDRWHREAKVMSDAWPVGGDWLHGGIAVADAPDWTYELIGPKVQGNPEDFGVHVLMPHGKAVLDRLSAATSAGSFG
jgi:hypothetical protein